MSFLQLSISSVHYEMSGPDDAPVLLFSNSLGTDLAMWDPQASVLSQEFRVLRYDTRGHGQSAVTPGPYSIDQLTDDVIELLDSLKLRQVYFCGLSMGGMIGMTLALRAADRLHKVALCSTAPKIGTADSWNTRIDTVRKGGMAAVVDGVLQRWYTADFRSKSPQTIESTKRMLLQAPVEGYIGCCAAVRDTDLRETLSGIRVPTLIITGAHDPVTTPADAHFMESRIAGARYRELPAAHLCNIEDASAFTRELCAFLKA